MKKIVLLTLFVFLMSYNIVSAQSAGSYETITPGNTPTGFTAAKIAPTSGPYSGKKAIKAQCIVLTNTANWTVDGTTPTQTGGTNVGMPTIANMTVEVYGYADINRFRAIDATASSASTLHCTYYFE
jgi:hypothetical protein